MNITFSGKKTEKALKSKEWLEKATTENAIVTINDDGCVIWHDGIWYDGEWKQGIWEDGTWHLGFWEDGTWLKGTWHNGNWNRGTWISGIWFDGIWIDGEWHNGIWHKGAWNKGNWITGIWKDKSINRIIYMLSLSGIYQDDKGYFTGYRVVEKDLKGIFNGYFKQKEGRVNIKDYYPKGFGTCVPGLHVSNISYVLNYCSRDFNCRLFRAKFKLEDVLDCDGEKARLKGAICKEVPWPFIPSSISKFNKRKRIKRK